VLLPTQQLWFRQDLRLHDHPAFAAAIASGAVLPVYILDEESSGEHRMGAARRSWLLHSLDALRKNLAVLGAPLILRRGRSSATPPAYPLPIVSHEGARTRALAAWDDCRTL
jgi:deoxyribodipyrimidine photo-lyase